VRASRELRPIREGTVIDLRRSTFPLTDTPALAGRLRCPLCGNSLTQDPWWLSPHWICAQGHSYSNIRVLTAELKERGWLSEELALAAAEYAD
jgi:hypothetical protein